MTAIHRILPDVTVNLFAPWFERLRSAEFRREHFEQKPYSQPRAARCAVSFLSWDTIDRILRVADPKDVIIAKSGALVESTPPRSGEELAKLFADGCSISIRRAEDRDPALALLARSFTEEFGGEVTIHIFATPAGYHGFGWHYDAEDVFIAQTMGIKEYFLRENTVNPRPTIRTMPRDMQFENETTPTISATLVPGDWLYIPSGWWHVAKSVEDSLHLSIGVLMPRAR